MIQTIDATIMRQPLTTLAMQLQARRDLGPHAETELETLQGMLVETLRTRSNGAGPMTVFHTVDPILLQIMADALKYEHDLELSVPDLERAVTVSHLGVILHAQLMRYCSW